MGLKLDGEIQCYNIRVNGGAKNSLVEIQDELQLHCYGLLEQVEDNLYRIVMD